MKNTFTRDVSTKMMEKMIKDNGEFKPFVDFVRDNKDKELALCFRGNDLKDGKVVIYKHNHKVWELSLSNSVPKVRISPDHARFIEKWDKEIEKLMNLGYRDSENRDYKSLIKENCLVKRRVKKKNTNEYSYHITDLYYYPKGKYEDIKKVVEKSYDILNEMINSYFSTEEPINCIKKYYFEKNSDASIVDHKHSFDANPQPCTEKHVQQELFLSNHRFKNGLFIYDLEFEQPKVDGVVVKNKNKPDMLGIRFDEDGAMTNICLIEVKSKWSALREPSGLISHKSGMEDYLKIQKGNGEFLIEDRKKEACRILNQYCDLELYGVDNKYKEEDFANLTPEIIFIFSHEVVKNGLDKTLHKSITIDGNVYKKPSVNTILSADKYESDKTICGGKDPIIVKSKKL